MPRFAAGVKTGAGNTTWPSISLFSSASNQVNLEECGLWNTSSTAMDVKLARVSSGPGTVGAGLTETALDNPSAVAGGQAFTTHTGGTPTLTDLGYRATLGAYGGAIFTFPGDGIEIVSAAATVNGVCAVVENGTGQALQAYFAWRE